MANLPKERLLIYDKPFSSIVVDYFGPFLVKHSKEPDGIKHLLSDTT